MHTHNVNGVVFNSDIYNIKHFTRRRSPRLDKKFYTGSHLTVILSVRFMMSKEHYQYILNKISGLDKDLHDITDYVTSLSYDGEDFEFQRMNKDHYLGVMFGGISDEYLSFTSAWEIHAPNQAVFKRNRDHLIKKLSQYLEVDNIKTFDMNFYDEMEERDEDVLPWNGENFIAYSLKTIHALS